MGTGIDFTKILCAYNDVDMIPLSTDTHILLYVHSDSDICYSPSSSLFRNTYYSRGSSTHSLASSIVVHGRMTARLADVRMGEAAAAGLYSVLTEPPCTRQILAAVPLRLLHLAGHRSGSGFTPAHRAPRTVIRSAE